MSRFQVLPGRMDVVEAWLAFPNEKIDAVIQPRDGENLLVETIRSEELEGAGSPDWFSIQGGGMVHERIARRSR
ncbi:DUF6176 family protein [Paeniglutamicibacter cryotolerans]|uniref:Uncharacterized protein n=1 Tax=Paeniglutamicibacter cryotolerans TaxID=670079 RepID=A0A839QE40_9MICC|nr:DUF6176 family protein [Paeniglutamicibacter cryotolerans]MBB2993857.1 hypothetical protein [Paeniglutamicibacter cryotolerans]